MTLVGEPLPPTVPELLTNPAQYRTLYPFDRPHTWRHSRARPLTPLSFLTRIFTGTSSARAQDTPAACLYRIYTFFILQWTTALRRELEYFCCRHPDWAVSELPDAADPDPLRAAVLAVLTQLMCEAFNRRIELGLPRDAPPIILDFDEVQARPKVLERPPDWAMRTPPLPNPVGIPNEQGFAPAEGDPAASAHFKKRNILCWTPHIYFV